MRTKLLTEHHLEFLSLIGCCTGSFESTHVKKPHCLKSHVTTHLCNEFNQMHTDNKYIHLFMAKASCTSLKYIFSQFADKIG